MAENGEAREKRISVILDILKEEYGRQSTALAYQNPLQLLVSTVLSAQCTDARVNTVTPGLFRKYKTASEYANADIGKFEAEIKSTGFYKSKAKNIIAAAKKIISEFGGKVPRTMAELTTLP